MKRLVLIPTIALTAGLTVLLSEGLRQFSGYPSRTEAELACENWADNGLSFSYDQYRFGNSGWANTIRAGRLHSRQCLFEEETTQYLGLESQKTSAAINALKDWDGNQQPFLYKRTIEDGRLARDFRAVKRFRY